MEGEDFGAPQDIDLYQITQELRANSTVYSAMVKTLDNTHPGQVESGSLYVSNNRIKINISPLIKYVYYWILMMFDITRLEKYRFIRKYITSKCFSSPNEKILVETIMNQDENSIRAIGNPGEAEGQALKSKNTISRLYDRVFIFFGIVFIIEFLYSLYIILILFHTPMIVVTFIGIIVFIYSILKITEPVQKSYFIISDLISTFTTVIIIYPTFPISFFGNIHLLMFGQTFFRTILPLSTFLRNIDILLFASQIGLSLYSLYLILKIKSKDRVLARRLPKVFRDLGFLGTEKINEIPKIPNSKENIVNLLKNFNTNISDLCPNCKGSGLDEEFETCKFCNGSGRTHYHGYKNINDDYQTSWDEPCLACGGKGGWYNTVPCKYCSNGHIDSRRYESEMGEFLQTMIGRINDFGDNVYKKINEINNEIDTINKKVIIWNSKTL